MNYVGGGGIRLTGRFVAWEYDETNPCSKHQQCPPGTDVYTTTIKRSTSTHSPSTAQPASWTKDGTQQTANLAAR
jgi:hypothetical protein